MSDTPVKPATPQGSAGLTLVQRQAFAVYERDERRRKVRVNSTYPAPPPPPEE